MRLRKVFGIIFGTYMGISFILSLFFMFNFKYSKLITIGLITPPGYPILYVVNFLFSVSSVISGILSYKIIVLIIAFLPTLVTSLTAGYISESKKQAFIGLILSFALSGIVFIVLYYISNEVAIWTNFSYSDYFGALNEIFSSSVSYRQVSVAIWIFIIAVLKGVFYSFFAIIFYYIRPYIIPYIHKISKRQNNKQENSPQENYPQENRPQQ